MIEARSRGDLLVVIQLKPWLDVGGKHSGEFGQAYATGPVMVHVIEEMVCGLLAITIHGEELLSLLPVKVTGFIQVRLSEGFSYCSVLDMKALPQLIFNMVELTLCH